jgi:hypothetical protein
MAGINPNVAVATPTFEVGTTSISSRSYWIQTSIDFYDKFLRTDDSDNGSGRTVQICYDLKHVFGRFEFDLCEFARNVIVAI